MCWKDLLVCGFSVGVCSFPMLDALLPRSSELLGSNASSDGVAIGSIFLLIRSVCRGGKVEPEIGFIIVLLYTLTHGVQYAEGGLGAGISS